MDRQIALGQSIVPQLALRGDGDQPPRRRNRRPAHRTNAAESNHLPVLRQRSVAGAVVFAAVAVSAVAIASQLTNTPARPRPIGAAAATSRPAAGLGAAAGRAIGAVEGLKHQTSRSRARRRPVRVHRRLHRTSGDHARAARSQTAISRSASPPPAVVTTPSTGSSGGSSSSGSSSSAPVSNSQPATTQPATTQPASAAAKTTRLPAGPLGPGGTVGTNCNPKTGCPSWCSSAPRGGA